MYRPTLLLLALCLALPTAARAAELRTTPSLCAINENETRCNITVKLTFVADDSARYCLSVVGQGLVRCFAGSGSQQQLEVYVTAAENTRFVVAEGESGKPVASATLKVARYQPKRLHRHYDWGLL